MPRRKTIQPEPLQSFTLEDGTPVEVWDDGCWPIGRGAHKTIEFNNRRDQILAKVCADYLSPLGRKHMKGDKDYLSSPTKFRLKVETWGLLRDMEAEDSAVRKKMYEDIVFNINVLANAIEENKK